jgi:hypothetical protein
VVVTIVLGIVSLLVGVVLILFLILFTNKRRRRKQTTTNEENFNRMRTTREEKLIVLDTNQQNSNNSVTFNQTKLQQSQITYNELVIEREIGEGSYGKVCVGKWNAACVALKFCRKKGNLNEFMQEMKLMM